jgi:DNA mismatch repair protein MSH6
LGGNKISQNIESLQIIGEPDYDPSTLYVPQTELNKLSPFERQYWEVKRKHFDTVVFFKKGKFYELYENDAGEALHLLI